MKKTFLIVVVLLSAFCFISCKPKADPIGIVIMDEAETCNDAITISGYIVEVGMTSITMHTNEGEIMIFDTSEADMSRAIDAKAGDAITVFYLVPEDADELPIATMVEMDAHIEEGD